METVPFLLSSYFTAKHIDFLLISIVSVGFFCIKTHGCQQTRNEIISTINKYSVSLMKELNYILVNTTTYKNLITNKSNGIGKISMKEEKSASDKCGGSTTQRTTKSPGAISVSGNSNNNRNNLFE